MHLKKPRSAGCFDDANIERFFITEVINHTTPKRQINRVMTRSRAGLRAGSLYHWDRSATMLRRLEVTDTLNTSWSIPFTVQKGAISPAPGAFDNDNINTLIIGYGKKKEDSFVTWPSASPLTIVSRRRIQYGVLRLNTPAFRHQQFFQRVAYCNRYIPIEDD